MSVKEPTIYNTIQLWLIKWNFSVCWLTFAPNRKAKQTDEHTHANAHIRLIRSYRYHRYHTTWCHTTLTLTHTDFVLHRNEFEHNDMLTAWMSKKHKRSDGRTSLHINYQFTATNTQQHRPKQCCRCFSLSLFLSLLPSLWVSLSTFRFQFQTSWKHMPFDWNAFRCAEHGKKNYDLKCAIYC